MLQTLSKDYKVVPDELLEHGLPKKLFVLANHKTVKRCFHFVETGTLQMRENGAI